MRLWLIALAMAFPVLCWCQDAPTPHAIPVTITGYSHAEYAPPVWHLTGNVQFSFGQKRLIAEDVLYNTANNTAKMSNATFTTCDKEHPDYRIVAREMKTTPEQRLVAQRLRIYYHNFCLIDIPRLSIDIGPNSGRQTLLPKPGYNSRDGFFLTTQLSLKETGKTDLSLRIRPTTKRGTQGGLIGGYALDGNAIEEKPYVSENDIELKHRAILQPSESEDVYGFRATKPEPAFLGVFGAALLRERVYDLNVPDLQVTRLPEIGLHYISPRLGSTPEGLPASGLQIEGRASWGRFKETQNGSYRDRADLRGVASTVLARLGTNAAIRGSGFVRYSGYDSGDAYKVLGGAIDASRVFKKGSFTSIRLIGHITSGITPFEFDNVDIKQELQGAARYVGNTNSYGVLLRYDIDNNSLRDWEISFSHRMHCLDPQITWHKRFRQISLDVKVLGL
jgi:hypothetical protein